MVSIQPTVAEAERRREVVDRILDHIRANRRIELPAFEGSKTFDPESFALQRITEQDNPFGGTVGEFVYQFEGEEDLLHCFVLRSDGQSLAVEAAQSVLGFLVPTVPKALIWLKPGDRSHHFYFGHDLLLE